jgi:hypothetical protein
VAGIRPGDRQRGRDHGATAEQIARRGTAEFSPSLEALDDAIRGACAREEAWEAKVGAGIGAVIAFTLENRAAARAVTVCAGARAEVDGDPHDYVLSHFAELFEGVAPDEMLFPISRPEGIVETIAIMVRGHLLAGAVERLPALGPDLVHLALTPYLGFDEAGEWASNFMLPKPFR